MENDMKAKNEKAPLQKMPYLTIPQKSTKIINGVINYANNNKKVK